MKIYRKINKERIKKHNRESSNKYYLIHKERLIKRIREWKNNHPYTLLVDKLRHRINMALKGINKSASTMKLLGCSIEFFKNYYESKFTKGMTWEKVMNGEIHCDHIRPCASFDLNKPSEQRKCFHYINLQPLWAEENRQKGCKF